MIIASYKQLTVGSTQTEIMTRSDPGVGIVSKMMPFAVLEEVTLEDYVAHCVAENGWPADAVRAEAIKNHVCYYYRISVD